jgi:hypothetical protein
VNQHHGLAAEPGSGRLTNTEGECCGNSGIHGVTSRIEHPNGGFGCQIVLCACHTTCRDSQPLRPANTRLAYVFQLRVIPLMQNGTH